MGEAFPQNLMAFTRRFATDWPALGKLIQFE